MTVIEQDSNSNWTETKMQIKNLEVCVRVWVCTYKVKYTVLDHEMCTNLLRICKSMHMRNGLNRNDRLVLLVTEVSVKDIECTFPLQTVEVRPVRHFHYISWPVSGVPKTTQTVTDFLMDVKMADSTGPAIVHCSAGIGRTGVLIAIDVGLQAVLQGDTTIDVLRFVSTIRQDRPGAVQTRDQYKFIHQVSSRPQTHTLRMQNTVTHIYRFTASRRVLKKHAGFCTPKNNWHHLLTDVTQDDRYQRHHSQLATVSTLLGLHRQCALMRLQVSKGRQLTKECARWLKEKGLSQRTSLSCLTEQLIISYHLINYLV